MRILLFLSLFCAHVSAEECGLFQIEDFGDRIIYTLTDFESARPLSVVYSITNVASNEVNSMVNRQCYCVEGEVRANPDFNSDPLYKFLQVDRIVRGPTGECSLQNL